MGDTNKMNVIFVDTLMLTSTPDKSKPHVNKDWSISTLSETNVPQGASVMAHPKKGMTNLGNSCYMNASLQVS